MTKLIQTAALTSLLALLSELTNAQTCHIGSISASTPDSQFINHNDGTVTDTKTGLMWKRCSEGQSFNGNTCIGLANAYKWQEALQQTQINNEKGFAGFNNWRLPNIKELGSIVERQCLDPTINLNVFPNTMSMAFWSSSARIPGSEWALRFSDGWYLGSTRKFMGTASIESHQIRLVRGQ